MPKAIEKKLAPVLVACAVLAVFVATLIPGPIVAMVEVKIGLPYLHEAAHILLFFALGLVLRLASSRVKAWHVLSIAFFLGLLTEGLQHFAVLRYPTWGGVAQDMAGASIAVVVVAVWDRWHRQ